MNFNRLFLKCHKMIKISYFVMKKRQFYSQSIRYTNTFIVRSRRDADLLNHKLYDSNIFFGLHVRNFWLSEVLRNEEKVVSAPTFPESVTEGDVRFHKKAGDTVAMDEVVCDIETDKTVIPVTSPANGVIVELYAEDMTTVKSAQKLFKIRIGGVADAPSIQKQKSKISPRPKSPEPQIKPIEHKLPSSIKPEELKKEISQKEPLSKPTQLWSAAHIKVPPEDPTKEISGTRTEHRVKISRIRQRIAQRLKDAQNTCAMLTTFNEIDMSHIIGFQKTYRETFTKKYGAKLGFMSAFLKASVYALQDQPVVNAVMIGNEIIYRDYIDISIAVASPRGLLVPVIRNVEKMNYADIEKAIKVLGEKAKRGLITVEDMDGGTFTVSNGGVFGSLMGTPIINPPQSAILGMHGVFERPVAINNQVVIRPMMYVALTYDHRLIDGREAVLFLRKIKAAVENPLIIVAGL